jgi:hypothetical protein
VSAILDIGFREQFLSTKPDPFSFVQRLEEFVELLKSEGGHISSIKILQPEKKESL